jgi:hypothetical protein
MADTIYQLRNPKGSETRLFILKDAPISPAEPVPSPETLKWEFQRISVASTVHGLRNSISRLIVFEVLCLHVLLNSVFFFGQLFARVALFFLYI